MARDAVGDGDFLEVFVDADLATCESRDPKGLYKKARAGEIEEFTGVSAPYEPPEDPALVLDTNEQELADSVAAVQQLIEVRGSLKAVYDRGLEGVSEVVLVSGVDGLCGLVAIALVLLVYHARNRA